MRRILLASIASILLAAPAAAQLQPGSFYGHPVQRDGAHFTVGFGGGLDTSGGGLFHIMEIGGTFNGGISVSLLHTFIQNRGLYLQQGGADLIGGWMLELSGPLIIPELTIKVAAGLGGEHDQSNGIRPIGGFGFAYGFDFTWPLDPRHGPTIGVLAMHTITPDRASFGVGIYLGWTVF